MLRVPDLITFFKKYPSLDRFSQLFQMRTHSVPKNRSINKNQFKQLEFVLVTKRSRTNLCHRQLTLISLSKLCETLTLYANVNNSYITRPKINSIAKFCTSNTSNTRKEI